MSNHQAEIHTDDPAEIVRHHIRALGWAVLHVFPEEDSPVRNGFSHTVGLEESFGHPEVLVVGRTPPLAHNVLNAVGRQVRAGGRFGDWSMSAQVIQDGLVWFRACDPMNSAASIHAVIPQHPDARALHLLLPDRAGLFPWDPGTDAAFASQPHGMRYLTTGLNS